MALEGLWRGWQHRPASASRRRQRVPPGAIESRRAASKPSAGDSAARKVSRSSGDRPRSAAKEGAVDSHCSKPSCEEAGLPTSLEPVLNLAADLEEAVFGRAPWDPLPSPKKWRPPWETGSSPKNLALGTKSPPLSPKAQVCTPASHPEIPASPHSRFVNESPGILRKVLKSAIPSSRSPYVSLDQAATALISVGRARRRFTEVLGVIRQDTLATDSRASASEKPFGRASDADVNTFRRYLSKTFGNFTRAFGALKVAAHSGGPGAKLRADRLALGRTQLSASEFEWCLTSYLKYCDRVTSRRLFAALDVDDSGDVGLKELAPPPGVTGLMSLVEFRALLLERHNTLESAFQELEDYLEMEHSLHHLPRSVQTHRPVQREQFARAIRVFGLEQCQADHFFNIFDANGDGTLTLAEFLDALAHMPSAVLLHDFRQRLLSKHSSVKRAFEEIAGRYNLLISHKVSEHVGGQGDGYVPMASARLRQQPFIQALTRLGISEVEAAELFNIVDEDCSGDVSLDELEGAVREAAPPVSFEAFWRRFAAEWPEIQGAIREHGNAVACALLSKLAHPWHQDRSPVSAPSQLGVGGADLLLELSTEWFDNVATMLDVSRKDAAFIFERISKSSSQWREQTTELPNVVPGAFDSSCRSSDVDGCNGHPEQPRCYAQDFLEQLQFWTGDSPGRPQVARAEARARISAFKAELVPPSTKVSAFRHSSGKPKSSVGGTHRQRRPMLPKAPWRASFSVPALTPVFVAT